MTRYEHVGNAKVTTITAEVGPTDLTIPITEGTNWPEGLIGLFWVCLNKGLAIEEKVLCSGRSANTLQVFSGVGGNGRGKDGTVAQTHPINSTIEHIWTATEADEANVHLQATDGAHGYPAAANLVTLTGDQEITGIKTIVAPIIEDPAITDGTHVGGTHTAATHLSVTGAQAEQEFRVRNTYIGSGVPSDLMGQDGDIYIMKDA